MDKLLKKICDEYEVEQDIVEKIIELEKDNVHKKRRPNIYTDLRDVIEKSIDKEVHQNDH